MPLTHPSPNFDVRTLPISMLVLHYTGMQNGTEALDRLCDLNAKVSAHYLIEEDGQVLTLVDERHRAWHAGTAKWRDITNINSASIGIEIVNGGHDFGLPTYPDVQIEALIALARAIVKRHNISAHNIVGHSDIAPSRKADPGEHFPWKQLAKAGLGLWPDPAPHSSTPTPLEDDLARIGYAISGNGADLPEIIAAFQRHYLPDTISGKPDALTRARASALAGLTPTP
jgi:N-acetylmuramoyl-L-alanine amidase